MAKKPEKSLFGQNFSFGAKMPKFSKYFLAESKYGNKNLKLIFFFFGKKKKKEAISPVTGSRYPHEKD